MSIQNPNDNESDIEEHKNLDKVADFSEDELYRLDLSVADRGVQAEYSKKSE